MKYHTIISLLALSLFGSPMLHAQGLGQQYSISFKTVGWGKSYRGLYMMVGGEKKPVVVGKMGLSPKLQYYGPSPLVLYRDTQVGEVTEPKPVASVNLEGVSSPLLMLVSGQPDSPQIRVMDDSGLYQPAGMTVINMSSKLLAFSIGDERFSIPPDEKKQLDLKSQMGSRETAWTEVTTSIGAQDEKGDWRVVYRKRWPISDTSSLLVFAVEEHGNVLTKMVRNYLNR
ncbi:hypothetical protein [Rubellicoccus peritrichatus]|uniref:DUF3108 domain-containing protein n=1 Tax=Rubellicoccus peritrichatus TaxID=3080537 RepID=A0AAQ3LIH7_9BACT|nr:hypothetical protein [Puniceicoccus sp. CR14]WOO42724.1 hypothetical protein RZN69_06445 [Puniceicoccus sp. CR14]